MNDKTSYPLSWPEGWPRTSAHLRRQSKFFKPGNVRRSLEEARRELTAELDRLFAKDPILSTNVKLRLDGAPYTGQAQPTDVGVAVYFTLKKRSVSLACDKWNRVEDNIWAIVKHIEALRGQERWGIGSVEQAFRGYMALPGVGQTNGANWWSTLGVAVNASPEQARDAYLTLVKKHHPDRGGDRELFHRLQNAWEEFKRQTHAQ